jgi:hypothetical protein
MFTQMWAGVTILLLSYLPDDGLQVLIELAKQSEIDEYQLMHTVPSTPQIRGILPDCPDCPDVIAGKPNQPGIHIFLNSKALPEYSL